MILDKPDVPFAGFHSLCRAAFTSIQLARFLASRRIPRGRAYLEQVLLSSESKGSGWICKQ